MKLIVGLGNPGIEYEKTRHNAGFRFIDAYAEYKKLSFNKEKFGGLYTDFIHKGEKIILLKPQKYINLSGEVIKKYVEYFKIKIEDILIIVDDLDTDVGNLRIKYKGSSAGHNGLKNIEQNLNTKEYKRIKIGISGNQNIDKKEYVIGPISQKQLEEINEVNKLAPSIIEDFLSLTFDKLMNKYNKKR